MKFKGFVAAILTMVMILAMASVSFAAIFPDIEARHSWAKEYIEDMVTRGLLKGYTDGTFKPDNPISKLEAVILAARILGVTYEENADFVSAASNAFARELASYDIQYKDEVAYLLYWGALKISELPSYIGDSVKNTAMHRHEVAVLLTKVMGGESDAQSNPMIILDYKDESQIPASAKAYVQYISEKGIMKGMEDNKFMPMYEVTRAMMATMMYRAEEAMDLVGIDASVVSVNEQANRINASINGQTSAIDLPSNAQIRVDGLLSSISNIKTGFDIRINYQGDEIRFVEALSTRTQAEKTGVIRVVSNNSGVRSITVTPTGAAGEDTTTYTLHENCEIYIDKAEKMFTDLKSTYYVRMVVKNGYVTKITAETKDSTVRGVIKGFDTTGDSPVIAVKLNDGSEVQYDIMADVSIIRNSTTDELRNLSVGDSAELLVSAGRVKRITATSVNKNIEGTIEEIVISSSPTITLKVGNNLTTFTVAANTVFYVEEEQATIYDMKLGATAKVSVKSENIDTIKIAKTTIPSQIIGNVTAVNPLYNVLTMDVIDPASGQITSQTVVVRNNVKIIDNTSSNISTLRLITPGMSIIALGAIDNYGSYAVSTIIVTK